MEWGFAGGCWIESDVAGVACVNVVVVLGGDDGADLFANVPDGFFAGFWVELDEFVAVDVGVDEVVLPPDWAFAPFGNFAADGLDRDLCHNFRLMAGGCGSVNAELVLVWGCL